MTLLTVLMPAKNAGKFIDESIRSTLKALPENSKLLILNDGSTDNTLEIAKTYNSSMSEVISVEESLGISNARNLLLKESSSEFVSFMDSDDVCLPSRFISQLNAIQKSDLVFSRLKFINDINEDIGQEKSPGIDSRVAPIHLLLGNTFSQPTMLARRDAITALGGYRDAGSEDYDLYLRAAIHGMKITKCFIPRVKYRIHESQITQSPKWQSEVVDKMLLESYSSLFTLLVGSEFTQEYLSPKLISAPFLMQPAKQLEYFDSWWRNEIRNYSPGNQVWLAIRKQRLERLFKALRIS